MPNVMATQPNIGGARCESPVIQFLVPRRKVWLMPAAGVPCSNAGDIGERKTGHKVNFACGKIPSGARAPENVYIVYTSREDGQTYRKLWLTFVERLSCEDIGLAYLDKAVRWCEFHTCILNSH